MTLIPNEADAEAKRLRDVRTSADPKFVYRMTYKNDEGTLCTFHFLNDNLQLAKEYAEMICTDTTRTGTRLFGRLISVSRVRF